MGAGEQLGVGIVKEIGAVRAEVLTAIHSRRFGMVITPAIGPDHGPDS